MSVNPYFEQVKTDSDIYDLSHLNPFNFEFKSNLAKKTLRVHVVFTNHCFTTSDIKDSSNHDFPLFHQKDRKPRIFCPVRYRLSKDLPQLIHNLNNEKAKVKEAKSRRNWGYSVEIEDPNGPYHIFFEVRKTVGEKKKYHDIKITIESAYHEDPTKTKPEFIGRVGFQLLCSKVYLKKPLSTKR